MPALLLVVLGLCFLAFGDHLMVTADCSCTEALPLLRVPLQEIGFLEGGPLVMLAPAPISLSPVSWPGRAFGQAACLALTDVQSSGSVLGEARSPSDWCSYLVVYR